MKQSINIVWFKRDLRFTDNEPLYFAQQSNLPLLLIYIFEPTVMAYHDSDVRHWRFVFESLQEMNLKLKNIESQIFVFHNETSFVFNKLIKTYHISTIFSFNALKSPTSATQPKLFSLTISQPSPLPKYKI